MRRRRKRRRRRKKKKKKKNSMMDVIELIVKQGELGIRKKITFKSVNMVFDTA
jgi:hypothetical protein